MTPQAKRRKRKTSVGRSRKSSGDSTSGLLLLLIGFIFGVVSSAIYFNVYKGTAGDLGAGIKDLVETSRVRSQAEIESIPTTKALPQKPEEEEVVFDFFDKLKESQVEPYSFEEGKKQNERATAQTSSTNKEPKAPLPKEIEEGVFYMLQAGVFTSRASADQLKATIAQNTRINSHIKKQGDQFRVLIGPFVNEKTLREAHTKLGKNNFKTEAKRIVR